MKWFGVPTREERLREIAATLKRAFGGEPAEAPGQMSEQVRRLRDAPPREPPKDASAE